MPALIKFDGSQVHVAPNRVAAPGYTLYTAQVDENTVLPDGWVYRADDVTAEDFSPPWAQPQGAHDAYALGAEVLWASKEWRSIITANVWEPGVYGWVDTAVAPATVPAWQQPTGAHDAYSTGAVVSYQGGTWTSTLNANVWAPGVTGWAKQLALSDAIPVTPDWVQPTGAQDAYALGAQVMHGGFKWQSTVAANVWEPGVYGWVQV